jgi:hypothetical protein
MAETPLEMVARLRDEFTPQLKKLQNALEQTARGPGLREANDKLSQLDKAVRLASSGIKDALMPTLEGFGITSISAAGVIGGLVYSLRNLTTSSVALHLLSDQTKIAANDLNALQMAGQRLGVTADQMQNSLSHFADIMKQMTGGPKGTIVGEAQNLLQTMRSHGPAGTAFFNSILAFTRANPADNIGALKLFFTQLEKLDPQTRAMLLQEWGFPKQLSGDFLAQLAKVPDMITVSARQTKEWADLTNELDVAWQNFYTTTMIKVGPGVTTMLKIMTDATNAMPIMWQKLMDGIDLVTPKWFKRLILGETGEGGGGGGLWEWFKGGPGGTHPWPGLGGGGGAPGGGAAPFGDRFGTWPGMQGPPAGGGGTAPGGGRGPGGGAAPPVVPGTQGAIPPAGGDIRLGEAGAHGYQRGGVQTQPWLVDTVREASRSLPEGYRAEVISSVDSRGTGTPWHPSGRAIDIQIYDPQNNKVPYLGGPNVPGWSIYENMAIAARQHQEKNYPGEKFTWGGHFNSGTPNDRMHFQSGGVSARGFTPEQMGRRSQRFPNAAIDSSGVAKGSWFSQFQGKEHSWVDRGDKAGSNVLGVPDSQQGIALPSRKSVGEWFKVRTPDGREFVTQQTDVGPHPRTGKGIDISSALADKMGYSPKNFPTGGLFSYERIDKALGAASGAPGKIEGNANITVDVNAPKGTKVGAEADGVFKKTQVNRSTQMDHATPDAEAPASFSERWDGN